MYIDKNINSSDIIKNIENNDLNASHSRFSDDRIIDIYDFISIYFMNKSSTEIKSFEVALYNGNNRFSLDERKFDEVFDCLKANKNISKFSLSFYSKYIGSCTLTTRTHYEVGEKNIDSFENEVNELKNIILSLNPQFSGEAKSSNKK